MEHKSKGESLEKCQAELKKLRRKSQGSKNPSKYGEKEIQVSFCIKDLQTFAIITMKGQNLRMQSPQEQK